MSACGHNICLDCIKQQESQEFKHAGIRCELCNYRTKIKYLWDSVPHREVCGIFVKLKDMINKLS